MNGRDISINDTHIIDTRSWKWLQQGPSSATESVQFPRRLEEEGLGRAVEHAHEEERAVHGLHLCCRRRGVIVGVRSAQFGQ